MPVRNPQLLRLEVAANRVTTIKDVGLLGNDMILAYPYLGVRRLQ